MTTYCLHFAEKKTEYYTDPTTCPWWRSVVWGQGQARSQEAVPFQHSPLLRKNGNIESPPLTLKCTRPTCLVILSLEETPCPLIRLLSYLLVTPVNDQLQERLFVKQPRNQRHQICVVWIPSVLFLASMATLTLGGDLNGVSDSSWRRAFAKALRAARKQIACPILFLLSNYCPSVFRRLRPKPSEVGTEETKRYTKVEREQFSDKLEGEHRELGVTVGRCRRWVCGSVR